MTPLQWCTLHIPMTTGSETRFLAVHAPLALMALAVAASPFLIRASSTQARERVLTMEQSVRELKKQWHATTDPAERARLHAEADALREVLCEQGKTRFCAREARLDVTHEEMEQEILDLQRRWHEQGNYTERRRLHLRADRLRTILCRDGKSHHCPEQLLAGIQAEWEQTDEVEEKEKLHQRANQLRAEMCRDGQKQHCPLPPVRQVDIDRLAYAVAVAETSNCTAGTGLSRKNCHGIFGYQNGTYGPLTFATTEQSFQEFKWLWLTKYGDRFPTIHDARRYSGGPGDAWLQRVTIAYQSAQR